jgi:hypothetical protein
MLMLATISLLAGMALGQRFKVMALVPAFALVTLASGITHPGSIGSIVLLAAIAAAGLQIGYLGGVGMRKRELFHPSLASEECRAQLFDDGI